MSKLVKIYAVGFMQYTNCMNDVVCHNEKDMCYIDVGRQPFLVPEDQLGYFSNFGGGYKDVHFVGNMLVND